MNEEYKKSIEEEITLIKRENLKLKNDMEEMIITNDRKIDEMIGEFIKVIDSFDKSETVVKEKGLDQEEISQKAIKRMLQPKKSQQPFWINMTYIKSISSVDLLTKTSVQLSKLSPIQKKKMALLFQ